MQAPDRNIGRFELHKKQNLTVVHVSQKAQFDMNNKTNLKRIDKENERRGSYEEPLGVATSAFTKSAHFLRDEAAEESEQKPVVKMRTLI